MTHNATAILNSALPHPAIDIGRPVEWMLDPDRPEIILGVTYAFSTSGDRKTVWYTANKRRAKGAIVVTEPPGLAITANRR